MPRFVLLKHTLPPLSPRGDHWDFMLESGDVLRTWALDAFPVADRTIFATPLPDHRREYLDYEGPISNHRGSVARVDRGDYTLTEESPDRVVVVLRGAILQGQATLSKRDGDQRWRFGFCAEADRITRSSP